MAKKIKNFIDVNLLEKRICQHMEDFESQKKKGDRNEAIAVTPYYKKKFKEACAKKNLKMKDVVEGWIKTFIGDLSLFSLFDLLFSA